MTPTTSTEQQARLHTNDCVRQRAKFGARSKTGDVCSCGADDEQARPPSYQHRLVKVSRVKDATGAYCLDCQRVIADDCQVYWDWRKSQKLHERGTGHRTIMYRIV